MKLGLFTQFRGLLQAGKYSEIICRSAWYPKEFYSFDYLLLLWEILSIRYEVMIDDRLKLKSWSCGSCGLNVRNAGVYLPDYAEGWATPSWSSHEWKNTLIIAKLFHTCKKFHMHDQNVWYPVTSWPGIFATNELATKQTSSLLYRWNGQRITFLAFFLSRIYRLFLVLLSTALLDYWWRGNFAWWQVRWWRDSLSWWRDDR